MDRTSRHPRPRPGHPDGLSRRGFLGGALAAAGAAGALPTLLAGAAGAATPVAPTDGLLLVVTLSGGNDALNTLVPTGALRRSYEQLRGPVALPVASLLPGPAGFGLHPALPKLAARYARGGVAVVQGVGQLGVLDLSHFTTMASIQAGTASTARTTGWLGRFLDGVTEWDSGFRGAALGVRVPLHLIGTRSKVTAVPSGAVVWGGGAPERFERAAHDAVRAMGAGATGLGAWADRVATNGRDAVDRARQLTSVLVDPPADWGLVPDVTIAARLLNAGLGTRVVAVNLDGWDTHAGQLPAHEQLLGQLDQAVETFFSLLRPELRGQSAVLVLSEFGRRAEANGSQGTDHGHAGHALLIGDRVRGGLHGTHPSLTSLDVSGSLVPTVDFRQVYASILERWLQADPNAVLGKAYTQLDLFAAAPGR